MKSWRTTIAASMVSATMLAAAATAAAPPASAGAASAASPAAKAAKPTPAAQADALVSDFVYQGLALQPVTASWAGYHEHEGVRLDGQWDDYSAAGIAKRRQFARQVQRRLKALDSAPLDAERRADLDLVTNAIGLEVLELDRIQDYRHNPTRYVQLVGDGLYTLFSLNYAPLDDRYRDLIERLQHLPELLAQAMANLRDATEVWNRIAREDNDGLIALVDRTLRDAAPASMQAAYADAAGPALQALHDFSAFLATTLADRPGDWRLGKDNYERKCQLMLDTGQTAAQLLAGAEADLAVTRAELGRLAAPGQLGPPVLMDEVDRGVRQGLSRGLRAILEVPADAPEVGDEVGEGRAREEPDVCHAVGGSAEDPSGRWRWRAGWRVAFVQDDWTWATVGRSASPLQGVAP